MKNLSRKRQIFLFHQDFDLEFYNQPIAAVIDSYWFLLVFAFLELKYISFRVSSVTKPEAVIVKSF